MGLILDEYLLSLSEGREVEFLGEPLESVVQRFRGIKDFNFFFSSNCDASKGGGVQCYYSYDLRCIDFSFRFELHRDDFLKPRRRSGVYECFLKGQNMAEKGAGKPFLNHIQSLENVKLLENNNPWFESNTRYKFEIGNHNVEVILDLEEEYIHVLSFSLKSSTFEMEQAAEKKYLESKCN